MKNEKDNSQRLMMIALVFAIAVPWGLLLFVRGGLNAFSVVPLIFILIFLINFVPNYFFYRRCMRFAIALGGTIISHNLIFSKFVMESPGTRTEFSITRGARTPTYITMTSPFESRSAIKFWMRPTECFDKATQFFDKMLDVHPDDKLLLDNKFMISENTIPLNSIESLLLPVKQELLASLKVKPTINLDGTALVLTVQDFEPDDVRLSRYFKIIRETIAKITSMT